MIENTTGGDFQQWNDVLLPTKEEVLANQAAVKFSAKTSLLEKTQRVFNGLMFFIVGAKLLSLVPGVIHAWAKLSNMVFAGLNPAFLQIPAVAQIIAITPKIIVALAFIQVIRKVLAVIINHFVYIATLRSYSKEQQETIDNLRWESFEKLTEVKCECRRIALNKSGINYDAFAIEHETTKGNGRWVIVAGGNGWIGEGAVLSCVGKFAPQGFNVLFVNGPGVGRSSGFPTSYSIRAGQEAGLQFLENAVRAKKILMYGTSLGGGAQAEAIKNHEFRKDIEYMVWSDRSFDKLSSAASRMVTSLAKPLFFLLGNELDGIAGARRLEKLGITHVVTQNSQCDDDNDILFLEDKLPTDNGSDGVIPNEASLLLGLKKAGIQTSGRLKCYGDPEVAHNGNLPKRIEVLVEADIRSFLA